MADVEVAKSDNSSEGDVLVINSSDDEDDEVFEVGEPATETTQSQLEVELSIERFYAAYKRSCNAMGRDTALLMRNDHIAYLNKSLNFISGSYSVLDASRPWMVYWITHSLELLNALPDQAMRARVINFLTKCQNTTGGFGGGPQQYSHLAPSYAAINTLAILQQDEGYQIVDREGMYRWLLRLKQPSGGFCMHEGGEVDVRGTYCAMVIATMLNIMTPELTEGAAEYIATCQTYEGGIGGEPGAEAHGGYTFCAFAALTLLGRTDIVDNEALLRWAVQRQMTTEGGFQGRTNKLVDGCYSFWQGGVFPLLDQAYVSKTRSVDAIVASEVSGWMFDEDALQKYILVCCQDAGGLRDKPGKSKDHYHTCYCLSGLSVAQHSNGATVLGGEANLVEPIDPVFNVGPRSAMRIRSHFAAFPNIN